MNLLLTNHLLETTERPVERSCRKRKRSLSSQPSKRCSNSTKQKMRFEEDLWDCMKPYPKSSYETILTAPPCRLILLLNVFLLECESVPNQGVYGSESLCTTMPWESLYRFLKPSRTTLWFLSCLRFVTAFMDHRNGLSKKWINNWSLVSLGSLLGSVFKCVQKWPNCTEVQSC